MAEFDKQQTPAVTDAPWFWVMLFSLAGLAAVATIGPKFERREQSLEMKFHARERGLGREAVEQPTEDAPAEPAPWSPIFTLGPIMLVLGVVAVVAMVNVARLQRRRLKGLSSEARAKPQAASDHRPLTTDP
jgi:hypothetical protein